MQCTMYIYVYIYIYRLLDTFSENHSVFRSLRLRLPAHPGGHPVDSPWGSHHGSSMLING